MVLLVSSLGRSGRPGGVGPLRCRPNASQDLVRGNLSERSPEGPWELSGALLEVPNRSQELHKPQHDPPGAQKAPPGGLWAVIWRLLEASGPHFGASEVYFYRFQDTFRSLKKVLQKSLPQLYNFSQNHGRSGHNSMTSRGWR